MIGKKNEKTEPYLVRSLNKETLAKIRDLLNKELGEDDQGQTN